MRHQCTLLFGHDGDYIVWESLVDGEWVEHARWLVPGTQLED